MSDRDAEALDLGTIREVYDGKLKSDKQVRTFRNTDRLFPVRVVKRGAHVHPLPPASRRLGGCEFLSAGKRYDLVDYMALNRVTGMLVIKDGAVAFEDYEMGNTAATRWMSMSVVKSITAALVGAAIQDGAIGSIDDPVAAYVPALVGSAYDGVSIRFLLQMASGVGWDETYTNSLSDRRRMLEAQISQRPGAIMSLMAGLARVGDPGSVWNYSTGETHIAGAVVEAAVQRPLADYLSERIWARFGMESDATWWLEAPGGLEIGGSGFSATLRDYGRFGCFLLDNGVAQGDQILTEDWVRTAGTPKLIGDTLVHYGYMLWPCAAAAESPNAGAFQAIGIYGQHVYVNPRERVVIVVWGALPKPSGMAPIQDEDCFAAVVRELR